MPEDQKEPIKLQSSFREVLASLLKAKPPTEGWKDADNEGEADADRHPQ